MGGNNTQIYKLYKYDLEGNFVREFNSLRDALFIDNLHKPNVIANINGRIKHCKNNIYKKEYYLKLPKDLIPPSKKVYQYDLDGNFLKEFANPHQVQEINTVGIHKVVPYIKAGEVGSQAV